MRLLWSLCNTVQILSSMTGCPNTTSTHILRIETGCRSFESWADQRKLEYFFKLQEMPDGRLPKLVWQHNWQEGRRQGGQVKIVGCSHSGGCRVGWHGGVGSSVSCCG